ncbi:uncharacterized protein PV06_04144 [Exophiala oligosperma]|uniref:3-beta hydroxysteroid dehydrogenase/isomerase domain-containing protein n=1 Tax=Exophiala oligosperma TaxID=215243 RepID=A0A0D2ECT3_9EURO|nr:uncharacterized protein PV06_04144 [Exophiala oligosperma]KIW45789.1 hypothetical protein PV06_04144 [Exophiala oligosperma]
MDPVVIVTGAAGGIGLEIVRYLLEELKGRVVAVDIVRGGLDAMAEANPDRLEVILGDISAVSSHEASIRRRGLQSNRKRRLPNRSAKQLVDSAD